MRIRSNGYTEICNPLESAELKLQEDGQIIVESGKQLDG